MRCIRIGLIGEQNLEVRAHRAIPKALELAGSSLGIAAEPVWLPTALLAEDTGGKVGACQALWCVPNSPYESLEGALAAIRYARETEQRPFLGTCGGFQHALLEYARGVLGMREADHAESRPGAAVPFIHRLACSLDGAPGTIWLSPGSPAWDLYVADTAARGYHTNLRLNPPYRSRL